MTAGRGLPTAPTAERRVAIPGGSLQVAIFAPLDGEPVGDIVLLHQGLGSITQWGGFPAALAEAAGCRVIAYDRFGYGRSDAPPGPPDEDFLEAEAETHLPALLAALGIARPILYGHSDGATIALSAAATHPGLACAIVSEAAHVFSEVETTPGMAVLRRDFVDGDLEQRLARHHPKGARAMVARWLRLWTAPVRSAWSMVDRLRAIRCPVLVIQGDADEHGTLRQVDAILGQVGGASARLVLAGCGHSPHRDKPEAVLRAVAAFLAGLENGPAAGGAAFQAATD